MIRYDVRDAFEYQGQVENQRSKLQTTWLSWLIGIKRRISWNSTELDHILKVILHFSYDFFIRLTIFGLWFNWIRKLLSDKWILLSACRGVLFDCSFDYFTFVDYLSNQVQTWILTWHRTRLVIKRFVTLISTPSKRFDREENELLIRFEKSLNN